MVYLRLELYYNRFITRRFVCCHCHVCRCSNWR